MKLTVCYGHVKVIVPCGEGELDVKSLIEKSTSRYRKATNKSYLDHVFVKCLQTEDGGILDSDDIVSDICDDRDKLIAIFEETIRHRPENNGDSASTSSIESQNATITTTFDRIQPVAPPPEFQNEAAKPPVNAKRTATAPRINGVGDKGAGVARKERPWRSNEGSKTSSLSRGSSSASSTPLSSPDVVKETLRFNAFDRNLNRKSLSVGHPLLYSWIDAQEKMNESGLYSGEFASTNQQGSLEKPLSPGRDSFSNPSTGDFDDIDDISSSASEEIELEGEEKVDLGLKVQGYKNAEGRELGLIVHEVKSLSGRNGTLNVADRITEVNGVNLRGRSNAEAENILNKALVGGRVKLKRTRSHHFISKDPKNASSSEKHNTLPKIADSVILNSKEAPRPARSVQDGEIHESPIEDPKDLRPAPKLLTGKKLKIELMKGKTGLGFSITSRDVLTNGPSPVFIKNILANGAAIQDGRLHIGDQILEINGMDVSGKDQSKVLDILKKATGLVKIVVNRESKNVPETEESEEAMETVSNDSGISAPKDEILAITIPLNNLGPAGLGISVKGKISGVESCDLGIYIKSIIQGGAAAKDGRLRSNDRILRIEDVSLEGMPNDKAMDTMRHTMRLAMEKGAMRMIVSRKAKKESPRPNIAAITAPTSKQQGPRNMKLPSLAITERGDNQKSDLPMTNAPSRTKSYFKAVRGDQTDFTNKSDDTSPSRKTPPTAQTDNRRAGGKVVSVSSIEIPVTQPSRTVIVRRTPSTDRPTGEVGQTKPAMIPTEKALFFQKKPSVSEPPSYEETIESRSNSMSDSSTKPSLDKKEEFRLSDTDLLRTMSTSSRFSVDSLMLSPDALPFSRDAFGRLSMSERKGRAHLDATKSDFYSKMKKYRSLEDISFNKDPEFSSSKKLFGNRESTADDNDTGNNEEYQFQRGTATSSSTPWYAQRSVSPTALKLRSRSTAWNDSFRSAVDKTPVFYTKNANQVDKKRLEDQTGEFTVPITLTSNANYDANLKSKRKPGFFKGIGQFLKKGKQRRASESKDEIVDTRNEVAQPEPAVLKPQDVHRKRRPHSLNEDTIRAQRIEMNATRVIEREKREKEERLALLQRELKHVEETELKINGNLLRNEPFFTEPQESRLSNQRDKQPSGYGIAIQVEKRAANDGRRKSEAGSLRIKREDNEVFQAAENHIQADQKPKQQQSTREVPIPKPRSTEDGIAATAENEEIGAKTQKRFLPTSQLFYYGHSSLPRKFTMNNKRKTSAANGKSSAYSIEAQTEIFRRANCNREEFDDRSSRRTTRRSPTQADPGSITISHTAK